jgi:hypothetical protein
VNVPPPPIPPPAPGTASKVSYKAQFVTLDFAKRKSYTALALERDRSQPAPGKLWVWTCFYVPTAGGAAGQCRSGDPVEISQPFASGDKTNVTATASCPWCADAGAPTSGYYGRVSISTVSAEAARLVESQIDERAQAIPVVVQAASGRARSN